MLEQLPTEIGLMILKSCSDVRDLLALIGASPSLLRLYFNTRKPIFTRVVRNMVGEDWIPHVLYLSEPSSNSISFNDFNNGNLPEMSKMKAREIFSDEIITRGVIQDCIDDELETAVDLSAVEWLRLRRGMYNFRVAARLSETPVADDLSNMSAFCNQCSVTEILEMLYILYCLRNRFAKYLASMEAAFLHDCLNHEFVPCYEEQFEIFSTHSQDMPYDWNCHAPWRSDLNDIMEACQVPGFWDREWAPNYQFIDPNTVDADDILASTIPRDHDFGETISDGILWLRRSLLNGRCSDYHDAIHLGFMIWDDKRLELMSWVYERTQLKAKDEKWSKRYDNYISVENRVREARLHRATRGIQPSSLEAVSVT